MIAPQDEQSLQRMLGQDVIPADVAAEYTLRKRMFDGDGSGGPLGTLGCIDLLRFLGHAPPALAAAAGDVEWHNLPQDGSLSVEARFFGDWKLGVFLGFVEHGILAVKLDEDGIVHECHRHIVRLTARKSVTLEKPIDDDGPDARINLIKPAEAASGPDDLVVDEPEVAEFGAQDWSLAKSGDEVWVNIDGDMAEAKFVSRSDAGVEVILDGEQSPQTFAEGKVMLAGVPA